MRAEYEAALDRASSAVERSHVAVAVYTDDLDAGRGDLYTAVGLGRYLEQVGFEVVYLPQDRWYNIPEGTEIYVAMLETVDITRLPAEPDDRRLGAQPDRRVGRAAVAGAV